MNEAPMALAAPAAAEPSGSTPPLAMLIPCAKGRPTGERAGSQALQNRAHRVFVRPPLDRNSPGSEIQHRGEAQQREAHHCEQAEPDHEEACGKDDVPREPPCQCLQEPGSDAGAIQAFFQGILSGERRRADHQEEALNSARTAPL